MPIGRPSNYSELVEPKLDLICDWARHGVSNEQIANNLGVAVGTLYEYKRLFPKLNEALKTREEADAVVEGALYKRAIGYDYIETIKGGEVVHKHLPPDTTAALAWLNNRRPNDWMNQRKPTIEFDGKITLEGILRKVEGPQY